DDVFKIRRRARKQTLPQSRVLSRTAHGGQRRDALAEIERRPRVGAVARIRDPNLLNAGRWIADDLGGERDSASVRLRVDADDRRRLGQRSLTEIAAVEQPQTKARESALRARPVRDARHAMLDRRHEQLRSAASRERAEI